MPIRPSNQTEKKSDNSSSIPSNDTKEQSGNAARVDQENADQKKTLKMNMVYGVKEKK